MTSESDALDFTVRRHVYDAVMRSGSIPAFAEIASGLPCELDVLEASLKRLSDGHILVLQPGSNEILMASPFSAVPTPFMVESDGRSNWGNCIWDALGVLAMLHQDGRVTTSCGDCGYGMTITISDGEVIEPGGIAHFALPAKHWWDNIVFS